VKNQGFSLIELMVTVAIIGILAAIAYPSYTAYAQRAHRTDATATMASYAQGLERCYSQNFTYTPAGGCPGVPVAATVTPQGYYAITVTLAAAPARYTMQALPVVTGAQHSDSSCQSLTLDSSGKQGATDSGGADSTKTCWGSN